MSNVRADTNVNYGVALEYLYKELGATLLNIILRTKKGQVQKWIADPSLINNNTKKLVANLHDVVSILRSCVPEREARLWLVDHSSFLFGIPAKEIIHRPEDVRMAALNRVARGEDYEVIMNAQKEDAQS